MKFSIIHYPLSISFMWAVIETGGKQYKVAPQEKIMVEKLEGKDGSNIKFDRVLLWSGDQEGKKLEIGQPYLEKALVSAKILKTAKDKKVIVLKYKPKKRYRVKKGHRQKYTEVEITGIKG